MTSAQVAKTVQIRAPRLHSPACTAGFAASGVGRGTNEVAIVTADGELHEIDWVLSENLAWALRVEGIAARSPGPPRKRPLSRPAACGCWQGLGPDGGMEARVAAARPACRPKKVGRTAKGVSGPPQCRTVSIAYPICSPTAPIGPRGATQNPRIA